MIEQGTVVEVRNGKAVVELGASSCCGRCGMCSTAGDGKMRFETDAPPGIAAGDTVEVDIPVSRARAAVTVYLIPLGSLLLGAILGNWIGKTYWPQSRFEGLPAITGALLFVVLAFVGISMYERRSAKLSQPPTIRKME